MALPPHQQRAPAGGGGFVTNNQLSERLAPLQQTVNDHSGKLEEHERTLFGDPRPGRDVEGLVKKVEAAMDGLKDLTRDFKEFTDRNKYLITWVGMAIQAIATLGVLLLQFFQLRGGHIP